MKYTTKKALAEIKQRARRIKQKHERKILNILTTCTGFSLIALFAVISVFSGSELSESHTIYGSIILATNAGGCILAAVFGIVLGISLTLIIKFIVVKKSHHRVDLEEKK